MLIQQVFVLISLALKIVHIDTERKQRLLSKFRAGLWTFFFFFFFVFLGQHLHPMEVPRPGVELEL